MVADDARTILILWLIKHGYQSPSFLNSRYLEVEYLIESNRFTANNSMSESEYDEWSGDENEYEKIDETTEPEATPVPAQVASKTHILVY